MFENFLIEQLNKQANIVGFYLLHNSVIFIFHFEFNKQNLTVYNDIFIIYEYFIFNIDKYKILLIFFHIHALLCVCFHGNINF